MRLFSSDQFHVPTYRKKIKKLLSQNITVANRNTVPKHLIDSYEVLRKVRIPSATYDLFINSERDLLNHTRNRVAVNFLGRNAKLSKETCSYLAAPVY